MNISQNFVKGLIRDSYGYMLESYDALEEVWPQIYAEKQIDGDFWQETILLNSNGYRKTAEAEGYQHQAVKEGWTIYGRVYTYTKATAFSKNTIEDVKKIGSLIKKISGDWGIDAKECREEFYARPFNQGGMTAGDWIFNGNPESMAITASPVDLPYDSVAFFNLSDNLRTSKGGGTYYNSHALTLTDDNLMTIISHGESANNRRENDSQMNLNFDTLLLPATKRFKAKQILNSTLAPYLSTNTTNAMQGELNPIKWQYLTNLEAFFVGKVEKNPSRAGIVALKRQEPTIDIFQDKPNRCWWAASEMRIGFMMRDWRFWNASNATTA